MSLSKRDIPDTYWPSDNAYGLPLLSLERCADCFDLPIVAWGSKQSRSMKNHGGTLHFYTDDYRFSALWQNPAPVVNYGAVTVVEANYTVSPDMPFAEALYRIYKKRWLSRWWQANGLRVAIDMNVVPEYLDLNMVGVPYGWTTFATHGAVNRIDQTLLEYRSALARNGGNDILFMVYGGGHSVQKACIEYGWLYVSEQRDQTKGEKTK